MWTFQFGYGDAVGLLKPDGFHSFEMSQLSSTLDEEDENTPWLPVGLLEPRSGRCLLFEIRCRGPGDPLFSPLPSLKDIGHCPDTDGHYEAYQGHIFDVILAGAPDLKNHLCDVSECLIQATVQIKEYQGINKLL